MKARSIFHIILASCCLLSTHQSLMAQGLRRGWCWGFGLIGALTISNFLGDRTLAQSNIVADDTLGAENSLVIQNFNGLPIELITGGATRGENLFHSFVEFNVSEGRGAYFSSSADIQNILARVTGSNRSEILGTLGTFGDVTPNLFLINPNGILFGANASLDVGRSFYATTASGIQFGNQGEFSAANPQPPSPLLTINPSAFFFTTQANPGNIISQSQATQTIQGTSTDGLQVPNGQTLLLLGGNVTVDGGLLNAWGGRVEIGAVAGTGTVGLNANGSLSVPEGMLRADVVFTNGILNLPDPMRRADVILSAPFSGNKRAGVDVRLDQGGDIGITAGNISILDGSQIRAGIATGMGTPESQAGDLIVNTTGEIRMTGDDSRLANDVRRNAIGKNGNIQVTARSLVVTDGAQLSASTFGVGDAGNIVIEADWVSFSGVRTDERGPSAAFSRVEEPARGKGGTVQIFTNILEVTNGAGLFTSTEGIGDSGDLVIVARDRVTFDGVSPVNQYPSRVFTIVSSDAEGKGGNIQISTNTLEVSNDAVLSASTAGIGDAGNLQIFANTLEVTNDAELRAFTAGIGDAGNLQIFANTLEVTNGAVLSTFSSGIGNAGNLQISANTLEVTNGAQLIAVTVGTGDAGNIVVNDAKTVNISGTLNGYSSALFTFTDSEGKGGDIIVNTQAFRLTDGAVLSANTYADGRSGNITVNAATVDILNGGQMLAITEDNGDAGNITVIASDRVTLAGLDPTFTERLAQFSDRVPSLTPNSGIFVRSQASGGAGEINVTAPTIQLNQGILSAESATVDGGNINLSVPNILLLRNGSLISATAGTAQQGGNGGNIKIDTSFVVAVPEEDSDITANAFEGRGGNIAITAQGIFGLEERRAIPGNGTNDIDASSEFGVSGTVTLDIPDVDPSRGLAALPTNVVDPSQQIAQSCTPGGEQASRFVATGRGGLPLNPDEPLRGRATVTSGWVTLDGEVQTSAQGRQARRDEQMDALSSSPTDIVEADGWVVDAKGNVVLVARCF